MQRYKRIYKDKNNLNENLTNILKKEIKKENFKNMEKEEIKESEISDISTNIVLMLNQVLTELNCLNEKINLIQNEFSLLKESHTNNSKKIVENNSISQNANKRKITLIRDDNGKIVGADVIDVNLQENVNITPNISLNENKENSTIVVETKDENKS